MSHNIIYQHFHTVELWPPYILRITLGGIVLPNEWQKLFGWFNGSGLSGEMAFMKGHVGLSTFWAVAAIFCLVIGVIS